MSSHSFRVVDLRSEIAGISQMVEATTPEAAAIKALGVDVVRSGRTKDLVAKVYWQLPGQATNVVRLYQRIGDAPQAPSSTIA
jgi:hypothetical protein